MVSIVKAGVSVMSGNKRPSLPISALYDEPTGGPGDNLIEMMGSFDLDAYGAQDAAELRNLLAVVDHDPPTSGTGAKSSPALYIEVLSVTSASKPVQVP